jgi:hypothetical protein
MFGISLNARSILLISISDMRLQFVLVDMVIPDKPAVCIVADGDHNLI